MGLKYLYLLTFILFNVSGYAISQTHSGSMVLRLHKNQPRSQSFRETFRNLQVQRVDVLIPELDLYRVQFKSNARSSRAMFYLGREMQSLKEVAYVNPDHRVSRRGALPNDTEFKRQWSLNDNSRVNIGAQEAWSYLKTLNSRASYGRDIRGNEVVIAVIDDGLDINHEDIRGKLWINRSEIPGNGIDDDGNGYIDDINGWNAYENNGRLPVGYHGTHVTGITNASANNRQGIAGVSWNTKVMFIAGSDNRTSVVARAYGYIIRMKKLWIQSGGKKGANIVVTNSSFGVDGGDCRKGEFKVWNDMYDAMGQLGILSVVATANASIDVDQVGDVPTSCPSPYTVTVTNTDMNDQKNDRAGFGRTSIDLGAPGTDIFSTLPGGRYGFETGTSMATPHVAGAIGLLHTVAGSRVNSLYLKSPAKGALSLKKVLMLSADKVRSLNNMTVTGGRLNVAKAVKEVIKAR